MSRSAHRSHVLHVSLAHLLACLALAVFALHPRSAGAQGFPGGMGGMGGRGGGYHGGGRGERGSRGDHPRDSTAGAHRESSGTLADLALRHAADLQLSDSQTTALARIARDARVSRMSAVAALADLRDSTAPAEPAPVANDSTRLAILQHRRALAAALAQLHDVDVNARTATLALLSPAQQTTIEKLEGAEGSGTGERGATGGERPRDR